jgi:hypothetical protein
MRHLGPATAVETAGRLVQAAWTWTIGGLGELAASTGLRFGEPVDELAIPVEHPELPGASGYAVVRDGTDEVTEVGVALTEPIDQADPEARRQLHDLAASYRDALKAQFGTPDRSGRRWPIGERALELDDFGVSLGMTLVRQSGRAGERAAGRWQDLIAGLGYALAGLGNLEMVSFAIDGHVVLTATRTSNELWLVASGPDDEVEPIPLTAGDETTLAALGFEPPLGAAAQWGPQRHDWWHRVVLPTSRPELEVAAGRLVAAARDVYGASRPSTIDWYGGGSVTAERLAATAMRRRDDPDV